MLFFKDLVQDKMADDAFKKLYERECHICALTVKLVGQLDKDPDQLSAVLKQVEMTDHQWQVFKSGDRCHPETVRKLCMVLGMDAHVEMVDCPRL